MQASAPGVFTTLLVVDRWPHHLGLHVARLAESAMLVGLTPPDPEVVRREVARVVATGATDPADAQRTTPRHRLRLAWDGSRVAATLAVLPPRPLTTTALRAAVTRDPDSPTAGAKTEDLATVGRHLLAIASANGAGDAILATTDGRLCEGATSNVFYVVDGELRTPTTATGLLNGISRRLLVAATGAREVDAPYEVLHSADEIFLTSSLRGVQAVTAIDGRTISGPGPVTRAAAAAWDALPVDD